MELAMKEKRGFFLRYLLIALFFVLVCLIYTGRLIRYQIAGQDYYTASIVSPYTYRYETIAAQRGEIFDRNGKPLVVNTFSYNLDLDGGSMPAAQADKNAVILSVLADAEAMGEGDAFSLPLSPYIYFPSSDGAALHFAYNGSYNAWNISRRFKKLLSDLNLEEDADAEETAAVLMARYGITTKESKNAPAVMMYDADTAAMLLTLRIDMELRDFSAVTPYTLLTDISFPLLTRICESGVRGVAARTTASRVYTYPGYASHILGYTGKILEEDVEYFTSLGYPLDATVGISGAERAFEEYLHGSDGQRTVVEDAYGNIVDSYVSREPKAGANVFLTIDIDLQIVAEEALADNIARIVKNAEESGKELSGEDADAGALTAVNVKTGEVLALASQPTFDLSTFRENVAALNQDPLRPLFNRALDGTYQPGSTFKIGVAAAALTEGVITPDTIIKDEGVYTYYETYQPACWIYNQYKTTHGRINVTTAIQVSCNYFFYEVGRLLTIDVMNRYDRAFGLGVPTGIELNEKTGVLAGPDYRNENGLGAWNPGDTIAAAIGQSDNLFTPLQISVYIASILNNGTRLRAHLLSRVTQFYTGELIKEETPITADKVALGPGVRQVLVNAMKSVTENGSAARLFQNYPIEVGGKTGTAQVTEDKSANAIFTAFAPFDDPQIVVTCIIEQGANGTDAGFAVRDVFNRYFQLDT